MKRTPIIAALALALISCAHAEWKTSDLNNTVDQVNFVVNEGCSGTLIDAKNGLVLTADHCVSAQYKTIKREKIGADGVVTEEQVRILQDGTVSQLTFQGSESVRTVTYRVRLLATDSKFDLALLKVISPLPAGYVAAVLACSPPVRGDVVFLVGNPLGDLYTTVHTGIVSSVQRDYDLLGVPNSDSKSPLMQISAGVIGGNSGGSVWNSNGYLVGVPVLASRINEVLGFAVPLDSVKAFLRDKGHGALIPNCSD